MWKEVALFPKRDALGRLSKVSEPAGGLMATYSWDVRDKLRQAVVQAGSQQQTRSWTYDALGWLRSETLPELGGQAIVYEAYDPWATPCGCGIRACASALPTTTPAGR